MSRPSPTESATLFDVGTIKEGNDGLEYIVVTYTNKENKTIKKWKLFEINRESTKKDINLAISNLPTSKQKIIENLYKMKKELKQNKIDLFIIGQNIKDENRRYFTDIFNEQIPETRTSEYLYACFYLVKDHMGNVMFNNYKDSNIYIYHAIYKDTVPLILQLLNKYLKDHFKWNGTLERSITVTFEENKPEIVIIDDNFVVEINIFFKKPEYYNHFKKEISQNNIMSHSTDYSIVELQFNAVKNITVANKIMKHYFNLLYKNEKIKSFVIHCYDKKDEEHPVVFFDKSFKPSFNKKSIEYLSKL